mgnify:CR=1 FL=1
MLLVNAKIVDVLNGEISKFDAIRTNDQGEIVDVGASTTLNRNLAKNQEPTIDLDGRYLFPGLISCHTHLSVVFPFSLTDPNEDPAITAFRAAERAHDALHAGITTIRCVHEQNQVDLALAAEKLAISQIIDVRNIPRPLLLAWIIENVNRRLIGKVSLEMIAPSSTKDLALQICQLVKF